MLTVKKFEHLNNILLNAEIDFLPMEFIHGLITAVAIGPQAIGPSKWLPIIFYEDHNMPEFKSIEQANLVISTLISLYNDNLADIRNDNFGPLLGASDDENGQEIANAEMWCNGFVLGSTKWEVDWEDVDDDDVIASMTLMIELSSESTLFKRNAKKKNKLEINKIEKGLINTLPDAVYTIHDYWFENSDPENFKPKSVADNYKAPNPKIGRNDLCPCGSGKKFKRCCGAI